MDKNIEIFEKKGIITILIMLLENDLKINSKYQLNKILKLSNSTINRNIEILLKYNLIKKKEHIKPRSSTEIRLTNKGLNIAQKLKLINENLKKKILDN